MKSKNPGLIVILQAVTCRKARYFVSLQKFKRFDMHKKNVRSAGHKRPRKTESEGENNSINAKNAVINFVS